MSKKGLVVGLLLLGLWLPCVEAAETKLTAYDGIANEYFGSSVSVNGDTTIIGAALDDDHGNASGSAYVFVRSGGIWSQQQKLTASDAAADDVFGQSVSIDGDTAIIGAPNQQWSSPGSAYVFVRSGGIWSQQQKLTAGDGRAADRFGIAVSISGDTAIVGSMWDDDHGNASGSAYVFVRSGGIWSQQQKLTASDAATDDIFGRRVSLDGDTAIIGAQNNDDDGSNSGSAYVFVRSGGIWSQQQKLTASDAAAEDSFGSGVDIDKDTVIIGALNDDDGGSNSGSAYVFVRSSETWLQWQKLTASDAAAGDLFGQFVGIDGDTAIIGAPKDDGNKGAAYSFLRNGSSWTQRAKLTASDGKSEDYFGLYVSIDGAYAVVTGYGNDNENGTNAGAAYVYESSTGFSLSIYVSTGGNDANDGLTSSTPKRTIQGGIDAASDGDRVFVEDGIYSGVGNVNLDFKGKAILLQSINGPQFAIIDGQSNPSTRGFYFHSGEGPNSILEGFTITGGNADNGGGIYCNGSSPTIRGNIIQNNSVTSGGGGIYSEAAAEPTIVNNLIVMNVADLGAGINCRNSSPTIVNNTITENSARLGSGLYVYYSGPIIRNTIIYGNSPGQAGGDIYVQHATLAVSYSDIWNGRNGIAGVLDAINWDSNIDADPAFDVGAPEPWNQYRLSSNSPCIDKGSPADAPTTDILGVSRDVLPDIGAYEGSANHVPVANTQGLSTEQGVPVSVTLTGSDEDGDALTFRIETPPAGGTLSGNPPNVTYTPNPGYSGVDVFTFVVNDGTVDSASATVTIEVAESPVLKANPQSVNTNEETPLSIALTGSGGAGGPLSYTIVSLPAHGSLSGTAPNLTYTPHVNYYGSDSFTFKVSDGVIDSDPVTIIINVNPVNDPPVADDKSTATQKNVPVSITLTGSDVDGDNLSFSVVVWPEHGKLTGTPPNLTYEPNQDYRGSDSFTFKANDGKVDSNVATVSINVESVNTPPVAKAQQVTVQEDKSVPITLAGTDADGDTLTFSVVSQPSHGKLTGALPNLTYTPAQDYNGSDSFTFKASDGSADSGAVTVSLAITPVNDKPVATPQQVTVKENDTLAITLAGSDVDGDRLSFRVTAFPKHGTLSGNTPNLTYTPFPNYNGTDSFRFKANDGLLDSDVVEVQIQVTPVNNVPVANLQALSTPEDKLLVITLTGSDVDGDTLTFTVTAQPGHGTLTGSAPNLTYTPDTDYNGPDSFRFKVNDSMVDSAEATVSITVTPVDDPPVVDAQNLTADEDTPLDITLTGSDPEGKPITYKIVALPQHGTLSGSTPDITYTPTQDYYGPDSFRFKANDGVKDSEVAEVTLSIRGVNDPPVAHELDVTTSEDERIGIQLEGHDVDGDPMQFAVLSQPAHGVLSGFPPQMEYMPGKDYYGEDSFTYKANDGAVDSLKSATVHIHITGVVDRPVAYPQQVTTNEDEPVGILLEWMDADGDKVTFTIDPLPAHGVLTGTPPNLTYTPEADYYGTDSFEFQVFDGTLKSPFVKVDITIISEADAPIAEDQSVSTRVNQPVDITLVARDVEGDLLTYRVIGGPSYGSLTGIAPNLTYIPEMDYNGLDSFRFIANDGSKDSNVATVEIRVLLIPDANLEAAMREALVQEGLLADSNDPLDDGLLASLSNLAAFSHNIEELTGLEKCTRLKTLNLANNRIVDVLPLRGLTRLTSLNLTNNSIEDISPLSGLTSLETLALSGNTVVDVGALSGLIQLKQLFLASNRIADLSPLVANGGLSSGDLVIVTGNPLSAVSVSQHIPALRARGVTVQSDAVLLGDVDGDGQLTGEDASAILRHVVVLKALSQEQQDLADVSGDDSVSSVDAALILMMMAGKIQTFPMQQ